MPRTLLFATLLAVVSIAIGDGGSEHPLTLRNATGSLCFADEACSRPWMVYEQSGTTDRGHYCLQRMRFCATQGGGEGCMCRKGPPGDGWAYVDETSLQDAVTHVEVEDGANIYRTYGQNELGAMVQLIRHNGYRCDSVSHALPLMLSTGFKVRCNHFRYEYEIVDHGGRWRVCVDECD